MARKTKTPTPDATVETVAPAQPWEAPGEDKSVPSDPPVEAPTQPDQADEQQDDAVNEADHSAKGAIDPALIVNSDNPTTVPATGLELADGNLSEFTNKAATIVADGTMADRDAEREAMTAQLADLTDEERASFESYMHQAAASKLKELGRSRQAREIEVNLVTGQHYGKRIRRNAASEE